MADIVKLIYKGDEMAQGGGGSVSGPIGMNYTQIKQRSEEIATSGQTASLSYTADHDGWLLVSWDELIYQGKLVSELRINGGIRGSDILPGTSIVPISSSNYGSITMQQNHKEYIPIKANSTITITQTIKNDSSFSGATSGYQQFCIWGFMYYEI